MASDDTSRDEAVASALWNDDVGALKVNTGAYFERQSDAHKGDMVRPVSTTLVVLLFQFSLLNSIELAIWVPNIRWFCFIPSRFLSASVP